MSTMAKITTHIGGRTRSRTAGGSFRGRTRQLALKMCSPPLLRLAPTTGGRLPTRSRILLLCDRQSMKEAQASGYAGQTTYQRATPRLQTPYFSACRGVFRSSHGSGTGAWGCARGNTTFWCRALQGRRSLTRENRGRTKRIVCSFTIPTTRLSMT